MSSIYLFSKHESKNYSTNTGNHTENHSRVECNNISMTSMSNSRNRQFMNHSRKALNMNDSERRIKRNCHPLYKQSNQQSALFEKGLRKVDQHLSAPKTQRSLARSYRNKQTYNIMHPNGNISKTITSGGVKKVALYSQTKQSSNRETSHSKKKLIRNPNETHKQETDYYIKKLKACHNSNGWGNSHTGVTFSKKENISNQQNQNTYREFAAQQMKAKKTIKLCTSKNVSHLQSVQNGITLKNSENIDRKTKQFGIDFKQNYYSKERAIQSMSRKVLCGSKQYNPKTNR